VGESGSGKTTAARIVLGLLEPDGGSVHFDGRAWTGAGPAAVSERERRSYRPAIGAIHQDPLGSFDPRWNVRRILADALEAGNVPREAHTVRIRALLDMVRLPAELIVRLPLNLSGGQRQRVAIARALATSPKLIVCDEPVSALDVSVQAQVLDLLTDLQERLGVSFLFISHDLGVIRHVSDDIVVMRDGKVVETGPTEKVFADPRHPFTRELLAASLTRVAATGRGDARAAI
jgi:peptide/nickel transport system ATP-binding protein